MIVVAKTECDATTPLTFHLIINLHPSPPHQPQLYAYQSMSNATPSPPYHQGITAVGVSNVLVVAGGAFLLHVMHFRTGESRQSRSSNKPLALTSSPSTRNAQETMASCSTLNPADASSAEAKWSSRASRNFLQSHFRSSPFHILIIQPIRHRTSLFPSPPSPHRPLLPTHIHHVCPASAGRRALL